MIHTASEAEQRVLSRWGITAQIIMQCEMRVDTSLTEEYAWGWVVYLAPVRPEECSRRYKYAVYACEREQGYVEPVGTKGLIDALRRLEVLSLIGTPPPTAEQIAEATRRVR